MWSTAERLLSSAATSCAPSPVNWSEIKELQKANWVESAEASKLMANVTHAAVRRMINQHSAIFEPGIGKLQAHPATFRLKQHTPKFIKTRTVPFSQRDKVKTELNRLQAEGIISPVKFSDYATPIVPIDKSNTLTWRMKFTPITAST